MINLTDAWYLVMAICAFFSLGLTLSKVDGKIYKKLVELDTKTSLFIERDQWRYDHQTAQLDILTDKISNIPKKD
ncbi:hypothetical protein [Nodularia sphaerocarpa]|uniref:hypothetical protein n=1 Tax=Nodularia sphaerocarpa TaxID=137816 RepID=UPI001EFBBA2B|nr:hypothetical protein [Nodularia sphaerocarpa]MDB9372800.1 hypothetical protein [Nodularia sphaerocarpa CS-585]ULP74164.1 hypothetical protein BDGGKGIB_03827 [Nodularia sphaerocarpa UHCC 0038]